MAFKNDGSAVYGKGDNAPFKIMVPPDILAKRFEEADQEKFITVPSEYIDRTSGERMMRSIYVKPSGVWAIAPWLTSDADEEDDED